MKNSMLNDEQLRIMKTGPGFVAALDESGGSHSEDSGGLRHPGRFVVK